LAQDLLLSRGVLQVSPFAREVPQTPLASSLVFEGMAFSFVVVALLSLAPATAQNVNRIQLTARGEASHLNNDRGFALDQQPTTNAKKTYMQSVTGSTPTGYIQVGTPPKKLLVIFDTGSDKLVAKTWDTVESELSSIDQGIDGMVKPSAVMYNHNSSSTYVRKFMKNPKSGQMVPMKKMIAYGSGAAITDEGNDTVTIGSFKVKDFGLSEITKDSLKLLHTKKGISGVFGLQHMKNRSLGQSIFSRMRDADQLTSFGYCRGTGDNGTFLWGDTSTEGEELAFLGEMHWAVSLGDMKVVGNVSAPAAPTPRPPVLGGGGNKVVREAVQTGASNASTGVACPDDKCTAILDTGSNILAGPAAVMKALAAQVNVATDCSNFDSLPTIAFSFGGKAVTVHPEGYVMKIPMPKWAGVPGGPGAMPMGQKPGPGPKPGAMEDNDNGQGESLTQEITMDGSWSAVFKHLNRHHGIDLSTAMRDMVDFGNVTAQPQFLCMPALVPLDKHTKFGPLYIVGTPLLQTHYARWSFGKKDASPKIFIEKLADSDTCKLVAPTPADETASLEAIGSETVSMMRSEQRPSSPNSVDVPMKRGPMIRNIEDISFPHWARHLEDL